MPVATVIYAIMGSTGKLVYPIYSAPALNITFQLHPQFAAVRGQHETEQQYCMRDDPTLSPEVGDALREYVEALEHQQRCWTAASGALEKYKDLV
jgi:hypothetical protein